MGVGVALAPGVGDLVGVLLPGIGVLVGVLLTGVRVLVGVLPGVGVSVAALPPPVTTTSWGALAPASRLAKLMAVLPGTVSARL